MKQGQPGWRARRASSCRPLLASLLRLTPLKARFSRVVGDRQVLVPPRGGGLDDLLERAPAVPRQRRVDVQVAPEVFEADRGARSLALGGRLDLPPVFAHRRRDQAGAPAPRRSPPPVRRRPPPPVSTSVRPYSFSSHPRARARCRSLMLCALEPVKYWQAAPNWQGLHDAKVHLEPRRRQDRGLGVAASDDLRAPSASSRTPPDRRSRLPRRHHDVDVGDGLPKPAQAPAVEGALDLGEPSSAATNSRATGRPARSEARFLARDPMRSMA